ncbi:hypothetical protein [Halobacillus hunanensis]|uniref:hypothetical protein n=1 Tax=Halobacillus hunanensis TaxID=578214 RepID=UPI001FED2336|nr:hypothetical protein [Halobacillus hunanensis]
MDYKLSEFTRMHDEFINDWNEAMISGDTSSLERMTNDYYVAFFKGTNEQPIIFNRKDAVTGMRQSVKQMLGANKRFENRIIRLKNNNHTVVFYEQLIYKGAELLSRLFTIEDWQFLDGKWMIVREIEEPID